MPAIDSLATNVEHVDFLAGDVVFRQGDHGDRFYVIEAGEVEVVGDGQMIRMLGAGEGFGEIALLRDTPRTTTVRARARLHLFALDRRHFLRAVGDYQSSAAEAETLMAERLHRFDPGTGRGA
jgi:CRP-like cAMP-binding protein